jgi:hypothetical protein
MGARITLLSSGSMLYYTMECSWKFQLMDVNAKPTQNIRCCNTIGSVIQGKLNILIL